jgi:hypothetical protein
MKRIVSSRHAFAVVSFCVLAASGIVAQSEPITEENVIEGQMTIEFNTRTQLDTTGNLRAGSPALGAQDKYTFSLRVAKTTEFQGDITRLPNLYTKVLQRVNQAAQLAYKTQISVLNPKDLKQKKTVGSWVGTVPIDAATGVYNLAGGREKDSPLRIAVDAVGSAKSFTDSFAGRLVGKAEKKANLASYTYRRMVGDKVVQVVVQKSDPMRFEGIELAKGPSENYPRTIVNGRLDFDYETGNWYTDGIRFHYTIDGKEVDDVVTGSIKWVEDSDRKVNGKGAYEFNLRWNEEGNKQVATEASAFAKLSDEDAFFAVDNSIACMTGKIAYADTMVPGTETPASSKVTFNLHANKLTKQQIVSFFKLWMLCVGPTNDE